MVDTLASRSTVDCRTLAPSAIDGRRVCSSGIRIDDARTVLDPALDPGIRDNSNPKAGEPELKPQSRFARLVSTHRRLRLSWLPAESSEAPRSRASVSPRFTALLTHRFADQSAESLLTLFFNENGVLVGEHTASCDRRTHVAVSARELVYKAQRLSARTIVLAHNHPSGNSRPSVADVQSTLRLVRLANESGISVADHFIIGCEAIFSMRQASFI